MRHRILLDCGFGRYLTGKLPKAIANEFLYYQPSLLLWADELVCDQHALNAEANWADQGFLVSDLSLQLRDTGVIRTEDFSDWFDGAAILNLMHASRSDETASASQPLMQYSTPEPGDVSSYSPMGFEDLNALLYLSSLLGLPYVNTSPARTFYEWKFSNLISRGSELYKEVPLLEEILSVTVPGFELFPRNNALKAAETAKRYLLTVSTAYTRGEASKGRLEEVYEDYLKKWLDYDNAVRSEVLDNFALLMEFREDSRVRSLRRFLSSFSDELASKYGDLSFAREVSLRWRRKILEAEALIAETSTTVEFLDKCASYISFPVEAATALGGGTAAAITNEPLFLAIGLAPSFIQSSLQAVADFRRRKFAWHYFLLDFKVKYERNKELRNIDSKIKALNHY